MLNPDSELRLAQTLAISSESEEQKARRLKIASDLSLGFRAVSIIPQAGGLNTVYAVTRFEDDLFRVSADLFQQGVEDGAEENRYVYGAEISRISVDDPVNEPINKGCWSLETEGERLLWNRFRPGREVLTEEEFWRRYMASEFDPQRTLGWALVVIADREKYPGVHTLIQIPMESRQGPPK